MKLAKFFDSAVKEGIEVDARGRKNIVARLEKLRREYERMSDEAKATFDAQRLSNPFGDTKLLYGDRDTEIRTFITGIAIDERHLLYAEALRRRGRGVDLVVAHHTTGWGWGLASVKDVLSPMIDRMVGVGVPLKVAKKAVKKFMKEKDDPRRMLNNALIKMAESLDLPCATIHTPADNHNLWALRFTLEKIGQKQLVKQSPCMTNCAPKISNCHIADLQEIESGYIKIDFLRPFNVVSHFVLYSRIYVRIFSVDSKPFYL